MKTRILSIVVILILGAVVFSCGTNSADQTDTVDLDTVRTEAVSTYASSLTETLMAIPRASPTLRVLQTDLPPDLTATLEPSATPNPCYKLLWIADVTIPDLTPMKAGEVFTKTWLVQNTGGCAWRPGFTFQHVGGERMRGETVTLAEAIPTGAKRELSVQLVVPSGLNGLIQSSWRMADESGSFFGDTLSVNIVVGNTATPSATTSP